MKRVLSSILLIGAMLLLAGCAYGPDYGYVRSDGGYYGDYYSSPYSYDGGYYGPAYYGGWCCGPSFSLGFYGSPYYGGGYGHYRGGHYGGHYHGHGGYGHGDYGHGGHGHGGSSGHRH